MDVVKFFVTLCGCLFLTSKVQGLIVNQAKKVRPPNIIIIIADDLGWNDVSFHGSKDIATPELDRLANEGLILNNYYVTPMCSPSRSALMTGKYPIHTGMHHNVLFAAQPYGLGLEEKLLPQYLQEIGYRTHALGKWHLGFFQKEYTPTYRGFESHFGYFTGHVDYFDHTALEWKDRGHDLHDGLKTVRNYTGKYLTDVLTEKAEEIIAKHNKSSPLFLYLAPPAVHAGNDYDPLQTTLKYFKRFPNIKNRDRRLFAGMVAGLDRQVGQVFRALQARKMDKNTIILFTTDNGGATALYNKNQASNYPLRGGKDTLWEGGVRGTAFLWSPLLQNTPRVANQLISITDWLPTLLWAAGVRKQYPAMDGKSIWTALSSNYPSPRSEVLLNIDHQRQIYGLKVRNYKIVVGSTFGGFWDGWYGKEENAIEGTQKHAHVPGQVVCNAPRNPDYKYSCRPFRGPCLFDLEADPCEYHNLASEKPETLARMLARLADYNNTVVPPRNKPISDKARPYRNQGCWEPWVK